MKQVIRKGVKEIIVDEVPDSIPGSHHVLIRPHASLISSGTETASIHTGSIATQVSQSRVRMVFDVMKNTGPVATVRETLAKLNEDYAVIGYSGAGVVAELHPSVTDLEVGQRVAYGGEGTGHAESIVTGRQLVARMPDTVSYEDASFATLGSIALHAVRTAQIGLGDRVAVVGLGLVGQLTAQLAKAQGGRVIAIDLNASRVDLALRTGAADYGVSGSNAVMEQVAAVTEGRGTDIVLVCAASKSAAPCQTALEICRDRGRIVIVGAVAMEFPWYQAYLKEIQVLMSRAYGPGSYDPAYEKQGQDYPFPYVRWTENRNMEEVLRLIEQGLLKVAPLVSHQFPLADAPKAYETIMNPASGSLAVLLRYPEPAAAPRRKTAAPAGPSAAPVARSGDVGVALVGPGVLAKWSHIPALKKDGNAKLRAIYSSSGARAKGFASRYNCDYCTTEYDKILEDPNIHMVLITSRNQLHASQTIRALRAGKHVFVEKPMAITEQECLDIHAAVRESGKLLTVGFNRRFSPFYKPFRERLHGRSAPAVVHCRVNSPGISGDYWMADPAIGGAILGEACHFVDLMSWILGSEPVSVNAFTLPAASKNPIGENNMVASFLFADGSIGNLTYTTIGTKTSQGEFVEAFQQGLGLRSENFKELWINGSTLRRKKRAWIPDKGYDEQLASFLDAIRKGTQPEVTVLDGVRASIGCIRALESAREGGRVVPIDLSAYS
jgi:predicted dehydrogenase